jgi:hypothetical protein
MTPSTTMQAMAIMTMPTTMQAMTTGTVLAAIITR